MKEYEVTLHPAQIKVSLNGSDSLFEQLKRKGIHINSTCAGCASCARCVVTVLAGESHLNEIPFEEARLLGNVFHITKERLACQTRITGPITIDISMHEQPKKKTVTKRRSKDEVSQLEKEREQEREKEKELKDSRPKKLGGNKKPKAFRYDVEDENNE